MRTAFFIAIFLSLAWAGPNYLTKVDLLEGQGGRDIANAGLSVVKELDGCCLVVATREELSRSTFTYQILAEQACDKMFVFVTPTRGADLPELSNAGRVLMHHPSGVLLETDEMQALELERYRVHYSWVGTEPWVYREDEPPPVPQAVPDSLVWELVNRVSDDSMFAHIRRLQNFRTRYSTRDSCRRAVEWVQAKFVAYNCDSTALETWRSGYAPNVIGAKFGRTNRRPIYVICAHVDATVQTGQYDFCPGSDDNGSGTAAVVEAARVFADVEFANTVYFIGFTGEEQGLWGSDSFCSRAYRRGDSIKAALNFDMISYGRQGRDSLEVLGKTSNPACAWLVDAYIANGDTFAGLRTHRVLESNPSANSDHYSFLKRGYPALMGIECDFTPAYHTTGDTIGPLYYRYCGTNNWPLAARTTRAAVATIAKLAGAYIPTSVSEPGRTRPVRVTGLVPSIGAGPFTLQLSNQPADKHAAVSVFDAAGRCVRALLVSSTERGAPNAIWDGRDATGAKVPAGVYLLRLADGKQASTARCVLVE